MRDRGGQSAPAEMIAWRLALSGCVALAVAMGLGRFAQTPILPFMIDELAWSKAEAGWLASANFVGYFLGCLVLGFVRIDADRHWFMTSLIVSALSTAAMATTSSFLLLAALRLVGGIASASVLIMASALILARLQGLNRSGLGSLHFAGVGCGIALSALLADWFGGFGWFALWAVCGGVALGGLFIVQFLMPAGDPPTGVQASGSATSVGLGRLRLLLPAYALVGFGYVITATFISTILRETPELQHLETAAWLVVGLTGAPSIWIWSKIATRLGNAQAFAMACVVEAAGVVICVMTTDTALLLASAAMLGGTFMGLTALGLVRARMLAPAGAQRAIALMSAGFAAGQMAGPALAGWLATQTGTLVLPSMVAAAGLIVAAILAVLPDPP